MTSLQRIIKYAAIAFAVFLIVNIVMAISIGLTVLVRVVDNVGIYSDGSFSNESEEVVFDEIFTDIKSVDIQVAASKIQVIKGEEFKVQLTTKDYLVSSNLNNLKIEEKSKFIKKPSTITVYIPENAKLDKFNLEAGAGDVYINGITVEELDLDLGAGNIRINNVNSNKSTRIDGGVGKVSIEDCIFENLDLNTGVGDFSISAKILGNNDIDLGIGKLDLVLDGSDYTINAKKGLGEFSINNKKISNDATVGEGNQSINVDAGIGSVYIKYGEN